MKLNLHHDRVTHHGGAALILTLCVLTILTILLMAMAFSSGSAQHSERAERQSMRADNLARAGFDLGCAMAAKLPVSIVDTKIYDLKLEEGSCRISLAAAQKTNAVYGGNFVRPRPGDVDIEIEANPKGAARNARIYHYLVNMNPAHLRRLMYQAAPRGN